MSAIKDKIKSTALFRHIQATPLYRKYAYFRFKQIRKKMLVDEAIAEFSKTGVHNGSLADYKDAFKKTLCSYSEYMYQYEFWRLNEAQRKEYVSRLEMRLYYERHTPLKVCLLFWNKKKWLNYFSDYIHRQWIDIETSTYSRFVDFIKPGREYIAKPEEGSLGMGIFKVSHKDVDAELFRKLRSGRYIVEELIHNEDSMAAFHPSSLNTVRVTTLRDGEIIGTFIRFGNNGNLVDNAHAGGVFAEIDPSTGVVVTNGIDTDGHEYEVHPYSGIKIKGYAVPQWNGIRETVGRMHKSIPEAVVVGWDVCVNSDNKIEVIEGNHLPDIDVLQSPTKTGIRHRLERQLKAAGLPPL